MNGAALSQLSQVIMFASGLYRQRAGVAWTGYLRRDPMALLQLRPGRVDPYAIYGRLRASGPLAPTRLGNWVSTSHRVCDSVLRDRRFGASPAADGQPADPDAFGLSFLEMNPPDHSRLRRLAMPAFSPKAVAGYAGRVERTAGDLLDAASAAGTFDLVSGFAAPLPIAVITDLLGIPDSRSVDFARHGMLIGGALDGIRSLRHASSCRPATRNWHGCSSTSSSCGGASPATTSSATWSPPKATRSGPTRWCRCAPCCSSLGSRPRST
jgi:cytochrome P450